MLEPQTNEFSDGRVRYLHIDEKDKGRSIRISRNDHSTRIKEGSNGNYYLLAKQNGDSVAIVLTEEEMFDMFRAFLAVHDEIEEIKNDKQ